MRALLACPPGGCVLLQPGAHAGPLLLPANRPVHVFGRGQATVAYTYGHGPWTDALLCRGGDSSVDGVTIQLIAFPGEEAPGSGVHVEGGGRLRLARCDVTSGAAGAAVLVDAPGSSLTAVDCK